MRFTSRSRAPLLLSLSKQRMVPSQRRSRIASPRDEARCTERRGLCSCNQTGRRRVARLIRLKEPKSNIRAEFKLRGGIRNNEKYRQSSGTLRTDDKKHVQEKFDALRRRQRILIAGDVVFNNMHVYTAETDSMARAKWLNSLNKIRGLKPSVVIPGHSKVGASLDASTAVDFTENYLLAFDEELKKAKDPEGLVNTMTHPPTYSWQSNGARRPMLNLDKQTNGLVERAFVAGREGPIQSPRDGCQ
jgi:hypothetical protein